MGARAQHPCCFTVLIQDTANPGFVLMEWLMCFLMIQGVGFACHSDLDLLVFLLKNMELRVKRSVGKPGLVVS